MPDIRHELLIAAAPEKIYDALTSQNGLAGWWTPDVQAKPELNSVALFPFGPDYHKEMEITSLKPSVEVRWTCIAGASEWVGTNICFRLQSGDKDAMLNDHSEATDQIQQQVNVSKVTLLAFHHDDWKEYSPMFAECNYTWALFLRSLKLLCETGKGRPWPNQHRVEL